MRSTTPSTTVSERTAAAKLPDLREGVGCDSHPLT
jgi:hypothetical protein